MVAVSRRENGAATANDVEQWAVAITKQWSAEVRLEISREKHRARTTRYRSRRQASQEAMIREHQRLEETLRRGLAAAKHTLARDGEGQGLMVEILRLALQRERLNSQNTELRAALAHHYQFQKRLSNASFQVFNEDHSDSNDTGQEQSHPKASHSVNNPEDRYRGWRVHFADNSPPFYFYPFSRDIVDKSDPFDSKLTKHWPAESPVGTFMGWNLHQTKLFRDNNLPLLRVKLLKKFRCSIEDVYKVTCSQPKACRPTLAVPKNWGLNQRYDVTLQVLQVFDQDTHLIVDNIPGPVNLRYLCVARKTQWELKGGKRKMCLSMVAVDSEDNQRSRAASPSTNEVEWLTEGGMVLTLTELDGGEVSVLYEQWAAFENEADAANLPIQWTQFVIRWEQVALPSNVFLK